MAIEVIVGIIVPMKKKLQDKKLVGGFTLIELMIAIVIIVVLSTIVITSLSSARQKGRDAQRIRNIQEIQKAVELYIAANGYAPDLGNSSCRVPGSSFGGSCIAVQGSANWDTFKTQLNTYMKSIPGDPLGSNCPQLNIEYHCYQYSSPGSFELVWDETPMGGPFIDYHVTPISYKLTAVLESDQSVFGFGKELTSF